MNYWKDVLKHRKLDKIIILLLILFIIGIAFCSRCEAADPWSTQDKLLQGAVAVAVIGDWAQTRWMAERDWDWDRGKFEERNPILGKHPHRDRVDLIAGTGLILHTVVTHYLPAKYRPYWQGFFIFSHGVCIGHNAGNGAGFSFRF